MDVTLRDELSCIELGQQLQIDNIVKWYKEVNCDGIDMFSEGMMRIG